MFSFAAFKTFSCLQFSDVLIGCALVEISFGLDCLKYVQFLESVCLYFSQI